MNTTTTEQMMRTSSDDAELERLVRMRENSVGIDFKRTNYKIAELQNKIDNRRRRQ